MLGNVKTGLVNFFFGKSSSISISPLRLVAKLKASVILLLQGMHVMHLGREREESDEK